MQYVSPNISAYGYTPEEFTSGRRVYAEHRRPRGHRLDQRGRQRQGPRRASRAGCRSTASRDAEGETHWIRDFTHTVRGDDGAVTAYEGYIIDITRAEGGGECAATARGAAAHALAHRRAHGPLQPARALRARRAHACASHGAGRAGWASSTWTSTASRPSTTGSGTPRATRRCASVADVIRASTCESDVAGRVGRRRVRDPGRGRAGRDRRPACSAVRRRVEHANLKAGRSYQLSLSLGAVDWEPGDRATLQELIERADQRMYDDKRGQRR